MVVSTDQQGAKQVRTHFDMAARTNDVSGLTVLPGTRSDVRAAKNWKATKKGMNMLLFYLWLFNFSRKVNKSYLRNSYCFPLCFVCRVNEESETLASNVERKLKHSSFIL